MPVEMKLMSRKVRHDNAPNNGDLKLKHTYHIVFCTRYDTNRPVQSQKIARSLKFRMKEEEGLYYPCSENKGTDQLRGYREAGLLLCFRIFRLFVYS